MNWHKVLFAIGDSRIEYNNKIAVRNELWRWYRKLCDATPTANTIAELEDVELILSDLRQRIKDLES